MSAKKAPIDVAKLSADEKKALRKKGEAAVPPLSPLPSLHHIYIHIYILLFFGFGRGVGDCFPLSQLFLGEASFVLARRYFPGGLEQIEIHKLSY